MRELGAEWAAAGPRGKEQAGLVGRKGGKRKRRDGLGWAGFGDIWGFLTVLLNIFVSQIQIQI